MTHDPRRAPPADDQEHAHQLQIPQDPPHPEPLRDQEPARSRRDPETRRRDHEQIDRLADDVLPDLISRLALSGLGEIEVREDDWRVRLRRPAPARGGAPERGDRGHDRVGDRPARSGAPANATTEQRPPRELRDERDGQPVEAPSADASGTGPRAGDAAAHLAGTHHVIATSPTVGVFKPRPDVRLGSRIRAGDRVAAVDLLGVPQDVVAPEDGVVVDTLVEPGEGVEYGQYLIVIEVAGHVRPGADAGGASSAPMAES